MDHATVAIRADGSQEVGMGHVMRTLAVAEALRRAGARVIYLCANEGALDPICSRDFEVRVLNTDSEDLLEEIPVIRPMLEEEGVGFVFVDSFFASDAYFYEVSRFCPVGSFTLDKTFTRYLALVVSYLFSDDMEWLKRTFGNCGTRLLAGVRYIPLRDEFLHVTKRRISRDIDRLLIMAGGSDALGMCLRIVDELASDPFWDNIELHVVAGPLCSTVLQLRTRAQRSDHIILHESVHDMAALMSSCDLAITARGNTVFELASCGVPMVTFSTSAEQAEYGFIRDYLTYAGDARHDAHGVARECCVQAKKLALDSNVRASMRAAASCEGIDGLGSQRIAAEIIKIVNS